MVDAAAFLEALNSPPGNRLEALKGDLAGKHSIRINDQWRVQADRCESRRRGDSRLSPARPAECGHRIGVRTWQRNFRRFIPAKSCGKNFSFRLS
ncbi:MAG TPA: type II toxin-antitoxin system RelE/ParE family toxin [Bradyrhizobium sp.]|nr:type II toxin-antitoxin system RelE/ParE family toxin [Bradyrhizobium sp.]